MRVHVHILRVVVLGACACELLHGHEMIERDAVGGGNVGHVAGPCGNAWINWRHVCFWAATCVAMQLCIHVLLCT